MVAEVCSLHGLIMPFIYPYVCPMEEAFLRLALTLIPNSREFYLLTEKRKQQASFEEKFDFSDNRQDSFLGQ
ncbi:hypothetical protein VTL71DRAFT_15082 [Oculimacula yallundae]|uniref:Uncharacterized protein n=1 Tax=Oculimacula yallundae TaxID=86028 RepID=A0ABR4CG87_9HELO